MRLLRAIICVRVRALACMDVQPSRRDMYRVRAGCDSKILPPKRNQDDCPRSSIRGPRVEGTSECGTRSEKWGSEAGRASENHQESGFVRVLVSQSPRGPWEAAADNVRCTRPSQHAITRYLIRQAIEREMERERGIICVVVGAVRVECR